MDAIGPMHILLVLLVVVLFFGGKKIPELVGIKYQRPSIYHQPSPG
jgi:hypothetical protein